MTHPVAKREGDSPRTCWPAERFYWSMLDVPKGTRVRTGPLPIGLRPEFAEDVPESPDEGAVLEESEHRGGLHAVCTTISGNRVIICAARVAELRATLEGTLTLTPSDLPAFMIDGLAHAGDRAHNASMEPAVLATQLNLLVGAMEPPPRKAARARRRFTAIATLLICCILATIGVQRREAHDRALASAALDKADRAVQRAAQAMGAGVGVTPDTLPAVLAVAQRSAATAARIRDPDDASLALAELLERWPQAARVDAAGPTPSGDAAWVCSVQALGVSGENITISVTIEGDISGFLRAMTPPEGWTMEEPRLTNVGRAGPPSKSSPSSTQDSTTGPATLTRLNLTLRRSVLHALPAKGDAP